MAKRLPYRRTWDRPFKPELAKLPSFHQLEWRGALEIAEIFNNYGFTCRALKNGDIQTIGGLVEVGVAYERHLPLGSVIVRAYKECLDAAKKADRIPIVAFPLQRAYHQREVGAVVPLGLLLDLLAREALRSTEQTETPPQQSETD